MNPKWRYSNGSWSAGQGADAEGAPSASTPRTSGAEPARVHERTRERRSDPRLKLCYPIEVSPTGGTTAGSSGPLRPRSVTQELSARGAYFCTSETEAARCEVGGSVDVVVTVPHRLVPDGRDVTIDLRAQGRVVRVDLPARGTAGEDGVHLAGIALRFDRPFDFSYCWI